MHSKDIAKLAGVSVRTLRHYHQIGLLPEPPRAANGYRSYGIQHLVRVLRIGQLSGLGLRLSDIPAVLDRDDGTDSAVLEELNESLSRQIAVLEDQRRMIAALLEGRGPLDMPPEFAAPLTALEAGRASVATKAGREQAVLLGHVIDDEGRAELARLYNRLAGPELAQAASELGKRFDALGADSGEGEISDLADAYLERLGPWIREYGAVLRMSANDSAEALLWTHAVEATNQQQRQLMAEISARIADFPG